jgi:hypothetical protein
MWKKILVVFLFACALSSPGNAAEERYNIPIDNSPILGPADAPITMIEFLDFQ